MQDRPVEARRRGERRIGVQGLRSPHSRYSRACCGSVGSEISTSGARSGNSAEVAGPRSPPKPPSPRAKIDRLVVHSTVPDGSVTVDSLTMTAALPLSQISVKRCTDFAVPLVGIGPGTLTAFAGVEHLGQFDVDAGELHLGRLGHVEADRDIAERRQHLWGVVDQVAQLALDPSGRRRRPRPRW